MSSLTHLHAALRAHVTARKPLLDVLPYLHGLELEAEDVLPRDQPIKPQALLKVAVPALPRISNHTDFDALRAHPQVEFHWVGPGQPLPPCDLIVLPGSKSTRTDLDWLRQHGWDKAIVRHLRYGGKLIGICGGLKMLGSAIHDPDGIEGAAGSSVGLGWLALETTLQPQKQLRQVEGHLSWGDARVRGYEIHCGLSEGAALTLPVCLLSGGQVDGAHSADGQILGSYLHGLFDHPEALNALLQWAGVREASTLDLQDLREQSIERLAVMVEQHLDTTMLDRLLGLEVSCVP